MACSKIDGQPWPAYGGPVTVGYRLIRPGLKTSTVLVFATAPRSAAPWRVSPVGSTLPNLRRAVRAPTLERTHDAPRLIRFHQAAPGFLKHRRPLPLALGPVTATSPSAIPDICAPGTPSRSSAMRFLISLRLRLSRRRQSPIADLPFSSVPEPIASAAELVVRPLSEPSRNL